MKLAIGVVVTAIALFVFGFLYWAANPLPSASWGTVPDPAAAQEAVQAQFPETGVYNIPGPGVVPAEVWAMVFVRHELPESVPDWAEMLKGFAHYLLVAGVLALVLQRGAPLGANVRRAALLGLAAVVVVEGSDVVWWGYPLGWKLWGAVYHVLIFVLGALALGKFLPPASADDGERGAVDAEGERRG